MKKFRNWFRKRRKIGFYISIPLTFFLLFYANEQSGGNIYTWWVAWIFFSSIILFVYIINQDRIIVEKVRNFEELIQVIQKNKWQVIEQERDQLTIKSASDFSFSKLMNNEIKVSYSYSSVKISGSYHYTKRFAQDIRVERSDKTKKEHTALIIGLFSVFLGVGAFFISVDLFPVKLFLHNAFADPVKHPNWFSDMTPGNSVENLNNNGKAIETTDYFIYVENGVDIVRVTKDFKNKTYLVDKEEGYSISDLNIMGDWLYYSETASLKKLKYKETENNLIKEEIYNLGLIEDVHILGNWIYFLNRDEFGKLYKMDLNGGNVQKVLDMEVNDIAVYDSMIFVSYLNNENGQSTSFYTDSTAQSINLLVNQSAQDFVRWEEYYYFLGSDFNLYRKELGETKEPERVIEESISSYILTEQGIIYSVNKQDASESESELYKTDYEFEETELLFISEEIHGLSKIGESVLFISYEEDGEENISLLNPVTGAIKVLD